MCFDSTVLQCPNPSGSVCVSNERLPKLTEVWNVDRLLRIAQVREITSLSRSVIYEQMDEGRFPRPLKVGKQAVRWRESEIEQWIDGLKKSTGWQGSEEWTHRLGMSQAF